METIGENLGTLSCRGDHTIYALNILPAASERIQLLKRTAAKHSLAFWLPAIIVTGADKESVEDCVKLCKRIGVTEIERTTFFIKLVNVFCKALPTGKATLSAYRDLRTSLAAFDLYIGDFEVII